MKIRIDRDIKAPDFTLGKFYIDGEFQFYTCEDTVREVAGQPVSTWKIDGKTAIPAGTYKVVITFSNRFQKNLPLLLDVPGFSGVRIHSGNTAADTEGCILIGASRGQGTVGNSRIAMLDFMRKLPEGMKDGNVMLEIG